MHAIDWPEGFTPGATDNLVSSEIIVPSLSAAQAWLDGLADSARRGPPSL